MGTAGPHQLNSCQNFRLATSRPHDNPKRNCFGERIVVFRTRSGFVSDEETKERNLGKELYLSV